MTNGHETVVPGSPADREEEGPTAPAREIGRERARTIAEEDADSAFAIPVYPPAQGDGS